MTDIFLLLQVCSMSCGWGFWCYSWCGLEWFACFPCASVSPSRRRWGKWHIPHLLWWLVLFLCCWSQARIILTEFNRDWLPAGGSWCSAEKNPTFPVAVCHGSWVYVTWTYIQKLGFGMIILHSGKIPLPEYTFSVGGGQCESILSSCDSEELSLQMLPCM